MAHSAGGVTMPPVGRIVKPQTAFAGGVGADVTGLKDIATDAVLSDEVKRFSESNTRFVVEVRPENVGAFRRALEGLPLSLLGQTVAEKRPRVAESDGEWLIWATLDELKEAWQRPLRW